MSKPVYEYSDEFDAVQFHIDRMSKEDYEDDE